jgi:membrane protease YdiL (CAAX protease family)
VSSALSFRGPLTAAQRCAIATGILGFGWWLSGRVRHLVVFAHTNSTRLGFEMLGIELGLAALAIGVAFALPGPIQPRLGLGRSRLPLGVVIAIALGTLGLMNAIHVAFTLTLPRALEHSVATGIARGFAAPRGWGDYAIEFLGSVVGPALGEELFCRGLIQRGLARWIHPAAAILAAALVFGWLHQELMHGAMATLIGAYLGLAAYWSDSTRPAIAGHAANNFGAMLGSAGLAPAIPLLPGLFGGLGLAALAVLWAWAARPRGARDAGRRDPPA